ncbi:MAG TPA: hypothetical protein VM290_08400 [Gaiellaceae bacterium]|nr:hypothetical protein [Gaiellaceae bacterium]
MAAAVAAGWDDLVAWGVALLVAAYAAGLLAASAGLDPAAPLFAGGLVAAAELAHWSVDSRGGAETTATALRHAAAVAGVALGTAALGSVLLAAALLRPPGGPLVLALGVVAAVAAFTLLVRVARPPSG